MSSVADPTRSLDEALDDVIAFQRGELAMEMSQPDMEGRHAAPPVVTTLVPGPGKAEWRCLRASLRHGWRNSSNRSQASHAK